MNSGKTSTEILQKALSLHKQGNLAEAEIIYRDVLAADPKQSSALHLMGLLAVQQEKPDEAVEWLNKALAVNPRSAVCYNDLGLVLAGLEQFDGAESAFRRALELQPEFPEACLGWGELYRDFCYFDQALRCYEQALAQRPQFPEARAKIEATQAMQNCLSSFVQSIKGTEHVGHTGVDPKRRHFRIERRELLPHLLNALGLKGIGAEIGVKEGKFSERILRHWEGHTLYSVDPWREFPFGDYVDISNVSQAQHDELCVQTIRRLMRFKRRSVVWRLTSKEAANLLPNGSLDFCYIDADHGYRGVSEDIRLWFPKIRPGGILAGHDYIADGTYSFGAFGVQKAVGEFTRSTGLDLHVTNEPEGGFPSWFVVKR